MRTRLAGLSAAQIVAASVNGLVAGAMTTWAVVDQGLRSDIAAFSQYRSGPTDGLMLATLLVTAIGVTFVPGPVLGWGIAAAGDFALLAAVKLRFGPPFAMMVLTGLVLGGTLVGLSTRRAGTSRPLWLPTVSFAVFLVAGPRFAEFGLLHASGDRIILPWLLVAVATAVSVVAAALTDTLVATVRPPRPWGPSVVLAAMAVLSWAGDRLLVGTVRTVMDEFTAFPFYLAAGIAVAIALVAAGYAAYVVGAPLARWCLVAPVFGLVGFTSWRVTLPYGRLTAIVLGTAVAVALVRFAGRWVPAEAIAAALAAVALLMLVAGSFDAFGETLDLVMLAGPFAAFAAGAAATTVAPTRADTRARRDLAPADMVIAFGVFLLAAQHEYTLGHGVVGLGVFAWWAVALVAAAVAVFVGSRFRGPAVVVTGSDFDASPTQYVSVAAQ